ncbi:MAG TPA: hypothetical protein VJS68_00040 [Thermoplasmata archaeon]|nr:hypothetical protein [Thermoplasmata archaeon]
MLLLVDPVSPRASSRLSELEPVSSECLVLARGIERDGGGFHVPQFVTLSRSELNSEPPLLLDLTQDAVALYDPDGALEKALERLREKLNRRRAQRVSQGDGPPYWILDPAATLGALGEL